jgi:uncharacterized protein (DUF2236 family)
MAAVPTPAHSAGPARADQPRPLGPGSLLWRYAGDRRLAFVGITAGILQLMHPAIAAGVVEHSTFFTDPWDRVLRSIPQIVGVVYSEEPEALGHRVSAYHRRIRGTDQQGRPYDALDPATYWWAHATFQNAVEQLADRYDHRRLSAGERERLYHDGVEWYRRYGQSMAVVPKDHSAFVATWDRYCTEVLEMTEPAERVIDGTLNDRAQDLIFLPSWARPFQHTVAMPALRLAARGGLPDTVRRRFSIPWSRSEEAEYATLRAGIRELWRLLPPAKRFGPGAAAAFERTARS